MTQGNQTRRVVRTGLAVVLATIGILDCVVAARLLFTTSATTNAWMQHANDPDFFADRTLVLRAAFVASLLLIACGLATLRQVVAFIQPRRSSWLLLMIAAPLLHWAWLLARIIGRGDLTSAGHQAGLQRDLAAFAVLCGSYIAAWLITRRSRLRLAS